MPKSPRIIIEVELRQSTAIDAAVFKAGADDEMRAYVITTMLSILKDQRHRPLFGDAKVNAVAVKR